VAAELEHTLTAHRQALLAEMTARDGDWFDVEMDKLDRWAEDRRDSLKDELADMDEALKEAKKQASFAPTLPEKLERQRAARKLEEKREEPGGPTMRPAATSTGRRTSCLMRSASGWSSASSRRRSLRCGGG
jgi:hypothetical protein